MAKNFVFEIGTEEIPAGFMPSILRQLKDLAAKAFKEAHLSYGSIDTMGTPRRLTLLVSDLQDQADDVTEEHKGPSVQIAFDKEGNPTKAAIGFAKGKGLDVGDLVTKDGYIYATTTTKGLQAEDVLKATLPSFITGLSFGKSMHWANLDDKFVRPLRWIVALLDDQVIPVEFATVQSGKKSRGHRFLGQESITINHANEYMNAMEANFVMVDQNKRRQVIKDQLQAIADEKGATILWDDDLLDEITFLVEWPTALCGQFDASYLELPDAAIVTPMKDHQRYFPMVDKEGKLLNMFLTVRNGDEKFLEVVQHGNERVLRARLDDAKFFFKEDRKKSLVDRQEGLKKIVFQEGLGNLADKTTRLLELGKFFADQVELHEDAQVALERATELAKNRDGY